jgi:hypothetical protein
MRTPPARCSISTTFAPGQMRDERRDEPLPGQQLDAVRGDRRRRITARVGHHEDDPERCHGGMISARRISGRGS